MNKREEIEKLDSLVRKRMLQAMENDELEILNLLSPAVNYIKANEVTLEKEKGSVEKSVSDRVKEANARRASSSKGS